jgi:hypothetical protein
MYEEFAQIVDNNQPVLTTVDLQSNIIRQNRQVKTSKMYIFGSKWIFLSQGAKFVIFYFTSENSGIGQ